MTTMAPFCDKFYKRGDVSYKMCQSSFCFDCCSSELKINDQTDNEVRKCISKCLGALRKTVAANSSIPIRSRDLKEGEDPDKPDNKPGDPSQSESPAATTPAAPAAPAQPKTVKKHGRKKHHDTCFSATPNPKLAEEYCKINFDPSAQDERMRDIEKCTKVFCPMCCVHNFEDPQEMMDCQRKCRKTLDGDSGSKPKDESQPKTNEEAKANVPIENTNNANKASASEVAASIIAEKKEQLISSSLPNTPQAPGSFLVPKNNYFDEDELSFLSTICSSFETPSFSFINFQAALVKSVFLPAKRTLIPNSKIVSKSVTKVLIL